MDRPPGWRRSVNPVLGLLRGLPVGRLAPDELSLLWLGLGGHLGGVVVEQNVEGEFVGAVTHTPEDDGRGFRNNRALGLHNDGFLDHLDCRIRIRVAKRSFGLGINSLIQNLTLRFSERSNLEQLI